MQSKPKPLSAVKVWILSPHDAVPGETWGQRHAMTLAQSLALNGAEVTYWAANFSHVKKSFRSEGWSEQRPQPGITVKMVPVSPYVKNVSFARLSSLKSYADHLWEAANGTDSPDAIIASLPTPFLDTVAVRLSKKHHAPLITEYRDLWPEIFTLPFPPVVRPLVNLLLTPLYRARRHAFTGSAALVAVSKTYLERALAVAPVLKTRITRVMYHSGIAIAEFGSRLDQKRKEPPPLPKPAGAIWVIYAGTLGSNYDIDALVEAAKILRERKDAQHLRILIAGDGPFRDDVLTAAKQENSNISYLGALSIDELSSYYAYSDIGLSIYAKGSTVSVPAKAFDYYAAGLPVVNSVRGEFEMHIVQEHIGAQYEAGDARSLADSIMELASDQQLRFTMRRRLLELAPEYDREKQYNKMTEVLLELLPTAGPQ